MASALDGGCNLTSLERAVLGVHRVGDVPGFEIPARYFHFLRTGDQPAVEPVLEHNRRDIVSLAALMSHALWLMHEGPDACREPAEQLALGRLYERAGDRERARQAYERAAASIGDQDVGREALARLAASLRRDARYEDAARAWEGVLAHSGGSGATSLDAIANEALAVHYEHRRRDLAAARRYAQALERQVSARARRDVDHRIRRIDRKLGEKKDVGRLFPEQH
jgi:tetratricopeptide (TPR) repeat protein